MITWILLAIIMVMIASNGSLISKTRKEVNALRQTINELQADVDLLAKQLRIDDVLYR
jgi:hypothetical protein